MARPPIGSLTRTTRESAKVHAKENMDKFKARVLEGKSEEVYERIDKNWLDAKVDGASGPTTL